MTLEWSFSIWVGCRNRTIVVQWPVAIDLHSCLRHSGDADTQCCDACVDQTKLLHIRLEVAQHRENLLKEQLNFLKTKDRGTMLRHVTCSSTTASSSSCSSSREGRGWAITDILEDDNISYSAAIDACKIHEPVEQSAAPLDSHTSSYNTAIDACEKHDLVVQSSDTLVNTSRPPGPWADAYVVHQDTIGPSIYTYNDAMIACEKQCSDGILVEAPAEASLSISDYTLAPTSPEAVRSISDYTLAFTATAGRHNAAIDPCAVGSTCQHVHNSSVCA
jgi:hypothetical protein